MKVLLHLIVVTNLSLGSGTLAKNLKTLSYLLVGELHEI